MTLAVAAVLVLHGLLDVVILSSSQSTYRDAARLMQEKMAAGGDEVMLLGAPANMLSLMTGLPSKNDQEVLTTTPLSWRIETYRPTHYVMRSPIR